MAGNAPSISRRRVLGAAAVLPAFALSPPVRAEPVEALPSSARRLWTARLTRYRRLAAEAQAIAETGWLRTANAHYESEAEALAADHPPDADTRQSAAWDRLAEAEDRYWESCTAPLQNAAVALALTPAADLTAVREKIAVIRALRLQELEQDCLEVLEEDVARLAALLR
jgi:hypothetical protein